MVSRKPNVGLLAILLLAGSACAEPFGYSVNSDGFGSDAPSDNLFRINLATGAHERIGPMGYFDVEGLAFAADGQLYAVDDASNTLLRVSTEVSTSQRAFAVASNRGNLGLGSLSYDPGLAIDCEGRMFMASDNTRSLYQLNPDDGSASMVGPPGSLGAQISGLAANGVGVYGIGVSDDYNLYRIDTESGTATAIGPLGIDVVFNDAGLDFDAEGKLWAVIDLSDNPQTDLRSRIYQINLETGQASLSAHTLIGMESLAVVPTEACRGTAPEAPVAVPGLRGWALLLLFLTLLLAAGPRLKGRAS